MSWSEGTCNFSKYNFITCNFITNYSTLASDSHLLHVKLSLNTGYSECSSKKTNLQLIAAFLSTTTANRTIKWVAMNPRTGLVSAEGKALTIKKDGYYFLNLQVTLKTPLSSPSHETKGSKCTVSLKLNDKVLLRGWINTNASSTGLLGKVEELSAGGILEVTIDPPKTDIDETESLTHLDIIYMLRP